jgi:RimJ/RimL family protein N-acetyltransferase
MCAIETRPAIGTDRLILRPPVMDDAGELCQLANDIGVAGNLGTMPYPYRPADAEAFLSKASKAGPAETGFAVEHRSFGFMGMIGFKDLTGARPEVGYWLGRPFWGRGYATEALCGVLGWLRSERRRNVVWAGHFADNRASGSVLVKAGFLYTGDVELRPCLARAGQVATRMMVWLA